MINSILTRIVGTKNERELKRIRPVVAQIGSFEPALRALDDRALAAKTVEFRERMAKGATLDDLLPEAFAVVREARPARAQHAPLRRPAHRRDGAPPRDDRGDEDGRGQDPRRHPRRLPERALRQGRPRRDRERLPGQARLGVDGQALPLPRPHRRRHPAQHGRPRAPGRLRGRHHLRDEQRVRLRLPARQHEVRPRHVRPAGAQLRRRRRGGLDPHRRGADPAHHQRPRRGVDRQVLPHRPDHPEAQARGAHHRGQEGRGAGGAREDRRLHRRREGEDGHPDRDGDGPRGAAAGGEEPLGPLQHGHPPPREPGPARPHPLPPRRGLRGEGRGGHDRGRVHRAPHARPPLVGRAPPGGRGQGEGQDRAREPDPRHDHLPELLPHVRRSSRA